VRIYTNLYFCVYNDIGTYNMCVIFNFPCHTQAVERSVKLVTEASIAVCGQTRRDGFIRSRIESHRIMPQFHSKKDFKLSSV